MSPAKAAPAVRFEATLYTIDGSTILRLPGKASNQLPSRGQVAVQAAPRRSQHLEDAKREDAKREAPTVLFQPGRVHRPGPFEEREADQSAMIHLAYAVSEPCGPWGVSLG